MKNVRKVALLSILLAISIVVSYVESFIPIPIPGVKLGLANVVILLILYEEKWYNALLILILRIFIVGFMKGNFLNPTWFMSLSGGILSFTMMLIFSRFLIFSTYGVSVIGAVSHAIGQILVAMIALGTNQIVLYLPIISLLSLITGIFSGHICVVLRKRFSDVFYRMY